MTYDLGVPAFRAISLVLAGALGAAPLLPAQHAHEAEENGHSRIVLHQHAQPHTIGQLPGQNHRHDRDGRHDRQGTVDHPDDPVLTVSTVFTTSAPQTLGVPARVVVAAIQPVHVDIGRASSGFVERLIHGPPRAPSGLRAPPVSPA
jgi:1,6-anhydro-N-acetylmuramate kinase